MITAWMPAASSALFASCASMIVPYLPMVTRRPGMIQFMTMERRVLAGWIGGLPPPGAETAPSQPAGGQRSTVARGKLDGLSFARFVADLARVELSDRAVNQYCESAVRRRNLRLYLEEIEAVGPRLMLVGEAVSYRG